MSMDGPCPHCASDQGELSWDENNAVLLLIARFMKSQMTFIATKLQHDLIGSLAKSRV